MTHPRLRRKRRPFNGSPSDHAPTEQWPAQLRTDDVDGATYDWDGANDIGVMAIATFTRDVAAPPGGAYPHGHFTGIGAETTWHPAPGWAERRGIAPADAAEMLARARAAPPAPDMFPALPAAPEPEPLADWERDLLDEQARQMALPVLRDVPVTEPAAIGDYLRLPILWCEMPRCINWHRDPDSLGERDTRERAAAAGWRTDALGRLACPECQQTRSDYRTPQPVAWHHPEVRRRWNARERLDEIDAFRLGVEAELGRRISYENPALARAIAGATFRHRKTAETS